MAVRAPKDDNDVSGLILSTAVDENGTAIPATGNPDTGAQHVQILSPDGGDNSSITAGHGIVAISEDATYKYYWFEARNSHYIIMRKHKVNKVFTYTQGDGGYAAVYVDKDSGPSGSPTWASVGGTF